MQEVKQIFKVSAEFFMIKDEEMRS